MPQIAIAGYSGNYSGRFKTLTWTASAAAYPAAWPPMNWNPFPNPQSSPARRAQARPFQSPAYAPRVEAGTPAIGRYRNNRLRPTPSAQADSEKWKKAVYTTRCGAPVLRACYWSLVARLIAGAKREKQAPAKKTNPRPSSLSEPNTCLREVCDKRLVES